MKIIVTGGLGFIGSHLIKRLINDNHTVLNLDAVSYCSMPEALSGINVSNKYIFKKNNLSNIVKLSEIIKNFKPNTIYHLAAESHVDNSILTPDNFIKSNIIGTYNLLSSILINKNYLKNFKLIHISTDEVYGSLQNKKMESFSEESKFYPNSPYSASKASSDLLVRAWHKTYNIPAITTNCVNNFGTWQFPEKLIPVVIYSCLKNISIPVYGNGKNIREWIFVEDHTNLLTKIALKGKIGETYNIGSGYEIDNISLIKKICSFFDKNFPKKQSYKKLIKYIKDRPAHDFRYSINTQKLNKIIKKYKKNNFDINLSKTIIWYINNIDWLEKKIKIKI
tara:strand:- start:7066 stop:8076 length:1011 start_codon:yes stop_codon:yes gene_type:complete